MIAPAPDWLRALSQVCADAAARRPCAGVLPAHLLAAARRQQCAPVQLKLALRSVDWNCCASGAVVPSVMCLFFTKRCSWQLCRTAGKVHLDVLRRAHAQAADAAGISTPATGPFTERMLAKVKTIVPLVWRCVSPAGPLVSMLQAASMCSRNLCHVCAASGFQFRASRGCKIGCNGRCHCYKAVSATFQDL